MDYKQTLTRYKELKLKTQATKDSLSSKIISITDVLCTQRNRICDINSEHKEYPDPKRSWEDFKWNVSGNVIDVEWRTYRGGNEYNYYQIEFPITMIWDQSEVDKVVQDVDQRFKEHQDTKRFEKEKYELECKEFEIKEFERLSKKFRTWFSS